MGRRGFVLGLLLFAGSGTVDAQGVAVGTRVRVWATQPSLSKNEGTVVARQGDTLVIERQPVALPEYARTSPARPDTVRVEWSAVRRLDVWQGRSHARGALKGLLFGLPIGIVVGRAFDVAQRNDPAYPFPAMPAFGVVGAATGTFLGALFGSDQWRRVHP
jgi:hypothetical protein